MLFYFLFYMEQKFFAFPIMCNPFIFSLTRILELQS